MFALEELRTRLTTKLALWVTLAVACVSLVLGVTFDQFLQSTFLNATATRMAHAYQRLGAQLQRSEQLLQKSARFVVSDESLLASVELVNRYQDKSDYNPFLIDEEKKTLAQALLSHIKLSQGSYVAVYGETGELMAYAHHQGPDLYLGFVSFADGQTRIWSRRDGAPDYQPGVLPVDGSVALQHPDTTPGTDQTGPGVLVYARLGQALALQRHHSVIDPINARLVMSLDLGHVLDTDALDALSQDVNMDLSMQFDHPLAAQAQALDNDAAAVAVVDTGERYLGLMQKQALGSPVYFAVSVDKAQENAALNSHRLRFAVLSLAMALLLLGAMRVLLLRSLVRPLNGLMGQIQRIQQGNYAVQPPVNSGDELEAISRSVNTLAQAVQEREAALEKARQEEEYLSRHDVLTGLPNPRLLRERMAHAIDLAQRTQSRLAVLFVDLDQFKLVNDTLGHPVGDQLLGKIAERFSHNMRSTDTLARIGGDEFNVLIENIHSAAEVELVVDKYLSLFQTPFECGEHHISITASIGVALFPQDGSDSVTLLKHADLAVYAAKEKGRNISCFYAPELSRQASARAKMIHDLKQAIEAGDQFELYYQPKLSAATGRVVGAEALIRWHKPGIGLVPPAEFIPLAEETRQIIPIGDWVVAQACRDLARMNQAQLGLQHLSVNVSNVQLQSHDLRAVVDAELRRNGLLAQQLELELTESYIAQDTAQAIASLQAFRDMGLALSIDDFGTGYSSLSYLKKLPFTRLKIDKPFVDGLPHDPDSVAITRAIVGLARNFDLAITAEGVERDGQLQYLRTLGCDEVQGYHFAKPLPLPEFLAYCHANQAHQASQARLQAASN